MIKARLGAALDPVVQRMFPFLSRVRLSPDTLTVIGVVLAVIAGLAFATGRPIWAGLALLVSGFFDMADGVVARSQGTSSPAGGFFDSSMDRVSDLVVFSGIAAAMALRADTWGVLLVCWALSGSVMTSYTRARAERHLANFEVGFMERGERCVILILGAWTGYIEIALAIVAVGATATTVQRIVIARRLLRELDATGRDPTIEEVDDDAQRAGGSVGIPDARSAG